MAILSISNLYKKILAPILLISEKCRKEKDRKMTIRRRVEVIVERETVLAIVPGERSTPAEQTAILGHDLGIPRLKLSAAQAPGEAADTASAEHPDKRPS